MAGKGIYKWYTIECIYTSFWQADFTAYYRYLYLSDIMYWIINQLSYIKVNRYWVNLWLIPDARFDIILPHMLTFMTMVKGWKILYVVNIFLLELMVRKVFKTNFKWELFKAPLSRNWTHNNGWHLFVKWLSCDCFWGRGKANSKFSFLCSFLVLPQILKF